MRIFSVFDSKADAFLTPFFSRNHLTAMRDFQQAATDESHQFHIHAGDFLLFCLGEFDDETGHITPTTAPENLGSALQFRSKADIQAVANGENS